MSPGKREKKKTFVFGVCGQKIQTGENAGDYC